METLEEIYAGLMAGDAERLQCAKPELSGTLEDMYARLMGQDEAVQAANPYGCNQYGEGWKLPHNGMSRVPRGSVPQGGGASAGGGGSKAKGGSEGGQSKNGKKAAELRKGGGDPKEFVKAAGLTLDEDDSVEAIGAFLEGLRNRHPENAKEYERIVSKISSTDGRTKKDKEAAVARIAEQIKGVLCMCSPEVVKEMSDVVVRQEHLRTCNGVYRINGNHKIRERHIAYRKGASNETFIHEFVHHIHACSSDETWNKVTDYFRGRTKDETSSMLRWSNVYGKPDHFAVSFAPKDDYAGRIYSFAEYEIRNGEMRRRKRMNSNECGSEMVTRHLQKLALPAEDFARYWNDKQEGKYYWREAFVCSLNLLLNP